MRLAEPVSAGAQEERGTSWIWLRGVCVSPESSVLGVPTRNTEKCFILFNPKVSQQQSHLADNLRAEVIISVLHPHGCVGEGGTGQTEMAGPAPAGDFSSRLELTQTPSTSFHGRREAAAEGRGHAYVT